MSSRTDWYYLLSQSSETQRFVHADYTGGRARADRRCCWDGDIKRGGMMDRGRYGDCGKDGREKLGRDMNSVRLVDCLRLSHRGRDCYRLVFASLESM